MLMYTYTYMHVYIIYIYNVYMCGNTAYRANEPLKITAREIPSPRQPYTHTHTVLQVHTHTHTQHVYSIFSALIMCYISCVGWVSFSLNPWSRASRNSRSSCCSTLGCRCVSHIHTGPDVSIRVQTCPDLRL